MASKRIREEQIELHGHCVSYRIAGEGPAILLIHGVAGSSLQWQPVMRLLSDRFTLLAPDLLGHGRSAKPRGDYSLGAYAAGLRDLTVALGIHTATVVGHSLGGGIALQFAYQFRERDAGTAVSGFLGRLGLRAGPDIAEFARGYATLADGDSRRAFLHTLRAVIAHGGQRVNASDRLYLAEDMPSLIVWGRRDPIIPVRHAGTAHRGMPGSRLELFDQAGHFPQLDEPDRFAEVLSDFIGSTEPAHADADVMRARLVQ